MKYCYIIIIFCLSTISFVFPEDEIYVSNIIFIGNSAFLDDELSEVIKLYSPKFFSRSEFSQKKLNKDKIALITYYKSKGFLEVEIITEFHPENEVYDLHSPIFFQTKLINSHSGLLFYSLIWIFLADNC